MFTFFDLAADPFSRLFGRLAHLIHRSWARSSPGMTQAMDNLRNRDKSQNVRLLGIFGQSWRRGFLLSLILLLALFAWRAPAVWPAPQARSAGPSLAVSAREASRA